METMLDVAFKVISAKEEEFHKFDVIFENVERVLKDQWMESLLLINLTYEELRIKKIGELYRLLTVDGRFERNSDGLWHLSKYNVANYNA